MSETEREATLAAVQRILRDVFFDPDIVVDFSSTAADVDGWDSLSHVRLLIAIERHFAIRIAPLEADRLDNVGALVDLVLDLVREKSNGPHSTAIGSSPQ